MKKRGPKIKWTEEKVEELYNKILTLVTDGVPMDKACKMSGVNRTLAYNKFNDKQKRILREARALYSSNIYSRSGGFKPLATGRRREGKQSI